MYALLAISNRLQDREFFGLAERIGMTLVATVAYCGTLAGSQRNNACFVRRKRPEAVDGNGVLARRRPAAHETMKLIQLGLLSHGALCVISR